MDGKNAMIRSVNETLRANDDRHNETLKLHLEKVTSIVCEMNARIKTLTAFHQQQIAALEVSDERTYRVEGP